MGRSMSSSQTIRICRLERSAPWIARLLLRQVVWAFEYSSSDTGQCLIGSGRNFSALFLLTGGPIRAAWGLWLIV